MNNIVDATLPKTPITIGGKTYEMCLDLGALSKAEQELVAEGNDVKLLLCLPPITLQSLRILFAASLRQFQPDLPYKDALQLLNLGNVQDAYSVVVKAWNAAMAEPSGEKSEQNPTTPGA